MSWASAWDTLKYDPLGGLTTAVSSISDKVSSTETGAWLLEGASSVGTMASDVAGTVALSLEETADAAARTAQRYMFEEEVIALKKEIQVTKRRWGQNSWEAMDSGNMVEVAHNFEEAKARVQELLLQIQEKTRLIAELDEAASAAAAAWGEEPIIDGTSTAPEATELVDQPKARPEEGDLPPPRAPPAATPGPAASDTPAEPQQNASAVEVPVEQAGDAAEASAQQASETIETEEPIPTAPPTAPPPALAPAAEPTTIASGNAADADADLEAELEAMLKDENLEK